MHTLNLKTMLSRTGKNRDPYFRAGNDIFHSTENARTHIDEKLENVAAVHLWCRGAAAQRSAVQCSADDS